MSRGGDGLRRAQVDAVFEHHEGALRGARGERATKGEMGGASAERGGGRRGPIISRLPPCSEGRVSLVQQLDKKLASAQGEEGVQKGALR